MSDGAREPGEPQMSTRAKVLAAAVIVVLLIVVGYVLLRLSTPAIPPGQTPPAGHWDAPCGVCHSVDPSAPRIRVP